MEAVVDPEIVGRQCRVAISNIRSMIMPRDLDLRCEIPVRSGQHISLLTATANRDAENEFDALADVLWKLNYELLPIWVSVANGEFVDVSTALASCTNHTLKIHPEIPAAEANTKADVSIILSKWECEELVLFWADRNTAMQVFELAKKVEPRWWQYTREPTRSAYLNCLNLVEPIVFHALGHRAIDVFGSAPTVAECCMVCFRKTGLVM